jgi:hypothetical protein
MNGELIEGISIQVMYARRQNQENWAQQRWQPQPFVSAGFTPAPSNEFTRPEPIERQPFKRIP